MTQPAMMPPPLPGYPAPAAGAGGYPMPPPPAQPQGYPGPAVAAPQAAPPPQPAAAAPYPVYAQQPAPAPAPAYAPQPAQAPAGYAPPPQAQAHAYNPAAVATVGDIGAAIAAATGGDRAPRFQTGSYLLEVLETIVTQHPVERYLTFKARFRVIESTNPSFQPGAEGAYIEGLAYGAGRVQDCLIALMGFPAKAAFDSTYAAAGRNPELELRLLGNACGNPTSQQDGNHYGPNPLGGRRVRTVVTEQDKIGGPRSKNAGKPVHFINHVWSPA